MREVLQGLRRDRSIVALALLALSVGIAGDASAAAS